MPGPGACTCWLSFHLNPLVSVKSMCGHPMGMTSPTTRISRSWRKSSRMTLWCEAAARSCSRTKGLYLFLNLVMFLIFKCKVCFGKRHMFYKSCCQCVHGSKANSRHAGATPASFPGAQPDLQGLATMLQQVINPVMQSIAGSFQATAGDPCKIQMLNKNDSPEKHMPAPQIAKQTSTLPLPATGPAQHQRLLGHSNWLCQLQS